MGDHSFLGTLPRKTYYFKMADLRTPDEEKKHIKNYKNYERLLGIHDLNPAEDQPSPGLIDEKLRKREYHAAKKADIITKLNRAIVAATLATQLFVTRTGEAEDDGHQLRINLYQILVDNP